LAAGLVVGTLFLDVPTVTNPILNVRIDLGTLAISLGAGLSAVLVLGLGLLAWSRRRCEREMLNVRTQAAEERRRFVQRLDHELKNPLTAIRAGLANLANGPALQTQQEALDSVEAQVLRLSRLTSDLRKLAELETRTLEQGGVNVSELLQEVVALALEQTGSDEHRLNLTLPQAPWPLPEVTGDWDLLFLATYNLLDNALKFAQPGDTIEVRAAEDGSYVAVEVADTGPGIPQQELPQVWDELYRGSEARGLVPGSGLGLPLARAIIDRHGGQIRLRSRAGQGTVVTMRLPVSRNRKQEP
jgi:two-component system OmpR family sensor kinase